MIELVRFGIALGALVSVLYFGRLIHRASLERLEVERLNNRLLESLGVRLDSMHARVARLEYRIDQPPAEAGQQEA